jgi:hypothetical protein
MRPVDRHLIPDPTTQFFESDYEPKWPETFMEERARGGSGGIPVAGTGGVVAKL